MVRIVLWWTGLAASVLLVVAAFGSQSGACVDSSNAAAHHPAQARGLAACFWLGWLPSRCRHGCSDVPIKSGVLATRRGSPAPTAERAVCASHPNRVGLRRRCATYPAVAARVLRSRTH